MGSAVAAGSIQAPERRSAPAATKIDRRAFEKIYRLHYQDVYYAALRVCRNRDDAVDATQDAFITVFKRMAKAPGEIEDVRPYLLTSVRHASLKVIGKRKRATYMPDEQLPEPSNPDRIDIALSPERRTMIEDQQKIVRSAVFDLSPRQLEALSLYEISGMSYSEVAEKLDMGPNAVAQLIMRARATLRKAVRSNAVTKPESETCVKALKLLQKKADGKLGEKDAEWLNPHLQSCDVCKTNLAVIEEVGASYRSMLPPPALVLMERVFTDSSLLKASGTTTAAKITTTTGKITAAVVAHPLVATTIVAGVAAFSAAGVYAVHEVSSPAPTTAAKASPSPVFLRESNQRATATDKSVNKTKQSKPSSSAVASPVTPTPAPQPTPAPSSGSSSSSGSGGGSSPSKVIVIH